MLNKWLKAPALLLAVALLAGAVFVVNLLAFRPFSLDLFFEKAFITFALDDPELLTQIGIAEQFGYRRHNAHLSDASEAKVQRDFERWRRNLADLQAYDLASQTPDQRLSTEVLTWYIQNLLEGERFRLHNYPVSQYFGVQSNTADFLINQHPINDRRGAEDYLSRLGELGRKFDQVLDGLKQREARGIVPPRFVIDKVLVEMRAFVAHPARSHPLYVHFDAKVAALPGLADADRQALLLRGQQAVDLDVKPAYARLISFYEQQHQRATDDDGVWKLPDGEAFYAWRLRKETTTRMTPQQVHDLGLSEVARIEARMAAILSAQQQLQPGETAAAAMARLARDPRFLYPDTAEGRQHALADFGRMIREQSDLARQVIGLVPKAPIEVRRVPPFKEATAPGAYYTAPALDGSRPGVFYANLRNMNDVPRFGMRTLSVHEGVPGHHLQVALVQEQTGGPTFRKLLSFTAYSEGWALYAEWLAVEMGLYRDDPFSDLGRLQDEMLRAVRLVVDTGIHAKRWTRQQAIDYMAGKTGMAPAEVVSEVERYIVDPGQACAYKIGMLSLQAARQRAQQALGPAWNDEARKAFHDLLLSAGELPLDLVDRRVDDWTRARQR